MNLYNFFTECFDGKENTKDHKLVRCYNELLEVGGTDVMFRHNWLPKYKTRMSLIGQFQGDIGYLERIFKKYKVKLYYFDAELPQENNLNTK